MGIRPGPGFESGETGREPLWPKIEGLFGGLLIAGTPSNAGLEGGVVIADIGLGAENGLEGRLGGLAVNGCAP